MSLIKKIKTAVAVIGIKPNSKSNIELAPTVQEDVRAQEAVKRVRKHFEENWETILARSHNPHSADCDDPFSCTKTNCFEWHPDKIVSEPYIVSGPSTPKTVLNDWHYKGDRPVGVLKQQKKKIKKKLCPKGCDNRQYNHCYDCINNEA